MFSAQPGHRTGSNVPEPQFSCRAQQPPVITTIICEMEKDWEQTGSWWRTPPSANRAVRATIALGATAGSHFFPPWSRPDYNLKQAAGPLCLPLPTCRHPHFATLTQVRVVAGKELPKLLQAGFLPHRHGGSTRSILVRDSGDKRNDGPKGKGLLLLKGGPHTGLLCKEQMLQ